jgi:hypothetical protein
MKRQWTRYQKLKLTPFIQFGISAIFMVIGIAMATWGFRYLRLAQEGRSWGWGVGDSAAIMAFGIVFILAGACALVMSTRILKPKAELHLRAPVQCLPGESIPFELDLAI